MIFKIFQNKIDVQSHFEYFDEKFFIYNDKFKRIVDGKTSWKM